MSSPLYLSNVPITDHEGAIAFVHSSYQFGSKLGLENMQHLLAEMGNPHLGLKYIHVAGTNGKGSTCAFISQVLIAAGYRVGTYVSPYLESFNERIQINRESIDDNSLVAHTERVRQAVARMLAQGAAHPTEFEIVTAIGFSYFEASGVELVVLEVGLGGRLDSTNVIPMPLAAVITPVDYDHMQYLGDTLAAIAGEKAGIIKGGLVVSAQQAPEAARVIAARALETSATLIISDHNTLEAVKLLADRTQFSYQGLAFTMHLLGAYQLQNACTAIDTLLQLRARGHVQFDVAALLKGISDTRWAGRFEKVYDCPPVYIDGAHNVHGVMAFKTALETYHGGKRRVAVFGMLRDKDAREVLGMVAHLFEAIYTVVPDNPRALEHAELEVLLTEVGYAGQVQRLENLEAILPLVDAYKDEDVVLYCFGSLYYIGAVRGLLKGRHCV